MQIFPRAKSPMEYLHAVAGPALSPIEIGVDPRRKEQIFELFKRLHNAAEYPGRGMGLAVCKRIVERTGGRIRVESGTGRGATFHSAIPQ